MFAHPRLRLLAAFAATLLGCIDSPSPPATAASASSLTQDMEGDDPLSVAPNAPTDRSLTLDAYIRAGMPAHDRSWSGPDMLRAASVLAAIAQEDPGHLPRFGSPRSGEAFERITATDNLELYRNLSLPIENRLPIALSYSEGSNQIVKLYLAAFNRDAVGGSEMVELMGGQLRFCVVMNQLVREFLPTLDKEDPSYSVRMEGLGEMKNGLAGVVAGSLQTLTELHVYRESDLRRLAGYMQDTFPEIFPELPAGSRSESLVRLRSFSLDPGMEYLKAEIDAVVAETEAAVHAHVGP